MKKSLHLFIILCLSSSLTIKAQQLIDVADNTLKVGGFDEEEFYYGFCEGDQLVFNFEEVNGKELKEIEILEMPSSSKFMDYKSKKIENKTINITTTGIYKFRFSNSAMSGRVCKFKIQRIPADESTKKFNTSVYKKIEYDTTYTTVPEKYLIKKEYKTKALVPTSDFYINSGMNATFQGGKSRITIPVTLPKNTQEWYYVFSATRDKNKPKSDYSLEKQLIGLVDQTGMLGFGLDVLTMPPGDDYCEIYLLDFENSRLFEAKTDYRYFPDGSRLNMKSGIVKMTQGAGTTFYVGIKNPHSSEGVKVSLEVVAITLEEEWGTRDVQKMNVSSREVQYLKN